MSAAPADIHRSVAASVRPQRHPGREQDGRHGPSAQGRQRITAAKLMGATGRGSGHNHLRVVMSMRPRRRTGLAGWAVCRLIPLLIIVLPGGHHRAGLPGVKVDDRHIWASVCEKCGRVQATSEAEPSEATCSQCHRICTSLPLFWCKGRGRCGNPLVYSSLAEIRRRITCSKGKHTPGPRFIGAQDSKDKRLYSFEPTGSR